MHMGALVHAQTHFFKCVSAYTRSLNTITLPNDCESIGGKGAAGIFVLIGLITVLVCEGHIFLLLRGHIFIRLSAVIGKGPQYVVNCLTNHRSFFSIVGLCTIWPTLFPKNCIYMPVLCIR